MTADAPRTTQDLNHHYRYRGSFTNGILCKPVSHTLGVRLFTALVSAHITPKAALLPVGLGAAGKVAVDVDRTQYGKFGQ